MIPDPAFDGQTSFTFLADDGNGPYSCTLFLDDYFGQAGYEVRAQNATEGSPLSLWLEYVDPRLPAYGWQFATADGSALAEIDYVAAQGLLYGIQTLTTLDDAELEEDKSFVIHVWHPNLAESTATLTPAILDNELEAWFGATVQPAVEGDDLVLAFWLNAPGWVWVEYLAEDVSALSGVDYADPGASGGVNWVPLETPGLVAFGTLENTLDEAIRSFKIRVRLAGYPETEIVLEADILDDDEPEVLSEIAYTYDVLNHLIARRLDPDGAGPEPATDTYFSWLDGQIALQFDGSQASDLSHRYLYGPAVDQILADESVESLTSPGAVLWPLADHLGTPRDLAEYNAAASETTVASHRVYDSFGNLVSESNGAIEHLFGFTGVLSEATTGLNYHRSRWLDL